MAMFQIDQQGIRLLQIDFENKFEVAVASAMAYLGYEDMRAIAQCAHAGRSYMHTPLFAFRSSELHGELCAICGWQTGFVHCDLECGHCGMERCCVRCMEVQSAEIYCLLCVCGGGHGALQPAVLPLMVRAYYLSCDLNDAITRRGLFLRSQTGPPPPYPYSIPLP